MKPKLALCNIIEDEAELKAFAREHGFGGIEWSFPLDSVPDTPPEQSRWVRRQNRLQPLEVRYHCPFAQTDLGHDDPAQAKKAEALFRRTIRLISKVGGGYMTIHIGLGRKSTVPLSWEATINNLRRLVQYGNEHRVTVCLENLAWGWTSKPNLFEKLIRRSGAGVTFDVGHAYVCEDVVSRHYALEDFATPHRERVFNAHLYHEEIEGVGHVPPNRIEDMENRLDFLQELGCPWWVIEIHDQAGVLSTKALIDAYLERRDRAGKEPA